MNIEEIPIAELDLDPANVRQHDEKNLAAIKSSLKRFGQQKPIVVDPKGIVIAGNGTLTAARALGWDRIRIVRTQLEARRRQPTQSLTTVPQSSRRGTMELSFSNCKRSNLKIQRCLNQPVSMI